eukprot:17034-Amphidinium_carterae.1
MMMVASSFDRIFSRIQALPFCSGLLGQGAIESLRGKAARLAEAGQSLRSPSPAHSIPFCKLLNATVSISDMTNNANHYATKAHLRNKEQSDIPVRLQTGAKQMIGITVPKRFAAETSIASSPCNTCWKGT